MSITPKSVISYYLAAPKSTLQKQKAKPFGAKRFKQVKKRLVEKIHTKTPGRKEHAPKLMKNQTK